MSKNTEESIKYDEDEGKNTDENLLLSFVDLCEPC